MLVQYGKIGKAIKYTQLPEASTNLAGVYGQVGDVTYYCDGLKWIEIGDSGVIIDIGTGQTVLSDNKVYPTMTVEKAKEIATNIKSGKVPVIRWTVMGSLITDIIPNTASEDVNRVSLTLHGKIIEFNWQNSQGLTEVITPVFSSEQSGGETELYEHKIEFRYRNNLNLLVYATLLLSSAEPLTLTEIVKSDYNVRRSCTGWLNTSTIKNANVTAFQSYGGNSLFLIVTYENLSLVDNAINREFVYNTQYQLNSTAISNMSLTDNVTKIL